MTSLSALIQLYLLELMVCFGMAISFWLADRQSASSRALALALVMIGFSGLLNMLIVQLHISNIKNIGWLALPEGLAIIFFLEWILCVRKTIPSGKWDVRGGDAALRFGQLMGVLYTVVSVLRPDIRLRDFLGSSVLGPEVLTRVGFWIFAAPIAGAVFAGLIALILLLRRRPDVSERVRVQAFMVAAPFLFMALIIPVEYSVFSIMAGLMIFLAGGVQYHVLQGQRGQFIGQFLSPQLADIVSKRGLAAAMQQDNLEISVLACDLRGFTAYAQNNPSQHVLKVLSDYYAEVGKVVVEYGATIKDYAGDGILILIGAPIAMSNHANVSLKMADKIRQVGAQFTERWSTPESKLGFGVGIASGYVTLGIIGSSSRLEYTAVGSAVNLAARLCQEAKDQQILVAPRTKELTDSNRLIVQTPPALKGFPDLQKIYRLAEAV